MVSASRGSTKRTVMASPLFERSTSEYWPRSSRRSAVMTRSTGSKEGRRPCEQAAPRAGSAKVCAVWRQDPALLEVGAHPDAKPASTFAGRAPWRPSGPPERLVEFVGDVGGGHPDVVQVPFRPFGKLAAHRVALAPGVEGLGQLRKNAMSMMIYHRFVGENAHFKLLYLISCR